MKKSITILFTILACAFLISCNPDRTADNDGRAKYIFVMIGDGMGANQVAATESYLSWKAGNLGAERLIYTRFPVLGMCTTYSASGNITDSAASGTAIATGEKTYNGAIGVDESRDPLTSMAYTLKDYGYRIGIMSSVPVNHATPAAFYAHQPDRNMYYEIGMELPQTEFEFFAGSGILDEEGINKDLPPLTEIYEDAGYHTYYGVEELRRAETDGKGVVVLQPSSRKGVHNYEIEREVKDDRLAEVLTAAIEYLGDEDPFFIMCEGGEIDWAAHNNDIMSMIGAVLRFNEAVDAAYNFYIEHPDETLIIVTADHETGGLALGTNKGYMIDWEGLDKAYPDFAAGTTLLENRASGERHNIGWTTGGHTGTPVPIYAIGKGAEKFAGRIDNTDIYGKVVCD